jgi:hypothetical protein
MFTDLLKIAEMLLGRSDKLREADVDRRKRISLYFENISRCLSAIAEGMKNNRQPTQACEEFNEYARAYMSNQNGMERLITGVFGKYLGRELHSTFKNLIETRMGGTWHLTVLINKSNSPLIRKRAKHELADTIASLERAAGEFKAISVIAISAP